VLFRSYERLSTLLEGIQGRFILSINDVPELRDLFSWATIEAVDLSYRISGKATAARELIISG
jgi:DNA adenine methylase